MQASGTGVCLLLTALLQFTQIFASLFPFSLSPCKFSLSIAVSLWLPVYMSATVINSYSWDLFYFNFSPNFSSLTATIM